MKNLKLIGKGSFTKAYLLDEKTVIYETSDTAKLCIAEGMGADSELLPEITRKFVGEDVQILCPLYLKVTAPSKQLNKKALSLYKELRFVFKNLHAQNTIDHEYPTKFRDLIEKSKIDETTKEELGEIFDSFGNYIDYGAIRFEISPRNIATNENGDLILLDCFYDHREIVKIRRTSKR